MTSHHGVFQDCFGEKKDNWNWEEKNNGGKAHVYRPMIMLTLALFVNYFFFSNSWKQQYCVTDKLNLDINDT